MSNTESIRDKLRRWADESLEKAIFPECVATRRRCFRATTTPTLTFRSREAQ